jgi:hypothetical protein
MRRKRVHEWSAFVWKGQYGSVICGLELLLICPIERHVTKYLWANSFDTPDSFLYAKHQIGNNGKG